MESAVREFLAGEDRVLMAGGTDLVPLLKSRARKPAGVLSLSRIAELKELTLRGDGLFIGAMVTLAGVMEDPLIRQHFPALADSARSVASPQVRNQGTVGGNLLQERRCHYFNQSESWRAQIPVCYALGGKVCHQIPSSKGCRALYYSDLAPVLLAFDSSAEIIDGEGPKTLPLQELIHQHATGAKGKFILKGISIPRFSAGTRGKFLKAGVRSAIDFALVNVAVRFSPAGPGDEDPQVRIVVGAMSPEPFYLGETARALARAGKGRSCEAVAESALKEAESRISPIRETAVSAKTKKQSLAILRRAIQEMGSILPS